jgi:hypothetical protein
VTRNDDDNDNNNTYVYVGNSLRSFLYKICHALARTVQANECKRFRYSELKCA